MRHHVYVASDKYPIALLVKGSAFHPDEIERAYILPFEQRGIKREDIIVVALDYNAKGKAPPTSLSH
mgnify:FL=1